MYWCVLLEKPNDVKRISHAAPAFRGRIWSRGGKVYLRRKSLSLLDNQLRYLRPVEALYRLSGKR